MRGSFGQAATGWRRGAMAAIALALGIVTAAPAFADDDGDRREHEHGRWEHERWEHRGGYWRPGYVVSPPPVAYYGQPPVYYAPPPPVYYAPPPPPAYYAPPSLNVVIPLR